jgi:DNA-directed RNA polymerase subunit RPC12/RpoP
MKCPGQDTQYWTAEAIYDVECPRCSHRVEFFKDDTTRKCGHCGHRFVNPRMDFGCAAYCQYAEQCLGDLPPELVARQEELLKDRVAVAVKRHLKSDFKRIGHITRRVRHAEALGKRKNASLPVLLIAAYLWGLDQTAGNGDPLVARGILTELNAPAPLVEAVCKLIRDRAGEVDGPCDAEYALLAQAEQQAAAEAADRNR